MKHILVTFWNLLPLYGLRRGLDKFMEDIHQLLLAVEANGTSIFRDSVPPNGTDSFALHIMHAGLMETM